jgi:hypothetical protein
VTLTDQIADDLHDLLWRLAPLLGSDVAEMATDAHRLRSAAERLAGQLQDDDNVAAETAQDLMIALWPHDDPPREWWQTPLGQAVARSYGTEDAQAVSASVAAAMLGVNPSRVYALASEGKLDRHPDGGIVRSSVIARLRR